MSNRDMFRDTYIPRAIVFRVRGLFSASNICADGGEREKRDELARADA